MTRAALLALVLGACGRLEFDDATVLVQMSYRGDHGCGIAASGQLGCWGANSLGQLGTGEEQPGSVARLVRTTRQVDEVVTGEFTSCLRDGVAIECWGGNAGGKLGSALPATVTRPVPLDVGADVRAVELGQWGTLVVGTDGLVRYLGGNGCGQAGAGTKTLSVPPSLVPGLTGVTDVAISDQVACAVVGDGSIWCWGVPVTGVPEGNACDESPLVPQQLFAPPSPVVDLDGGCHGHVCAALADGSVWCLGVNVNGQIGNGTRDPAPTFTRVVGVTDAVEVAVGAFHTCVTRTGGEVVCWGRNQVGQLGRGTVTDDELVPAPVLGLTQPVDALEASCGGTCARSGGELWCWGANYNLQLGTGALGDSSLPLRAWFGPDPLDLD